MLAGHAYAGGVIGAVSHPRVKALVYVVALAPDEGETVADVFYRIPRTRRHQSSSPTATGEFGCPRAPLLPHSHSTPPPKNKPCSPRSSDRSPLRASSTRCQDPAGKTCRAGFSSRKKTA